jgi:exonuclease VII small subunit
MPTKKIKLQDKIKKLEDLGKYFNNAHDELDLEDAVEKYEEASALVHEIKGELNRIELKISEINLKNGKDKTAENDDEEFSF